MAAHGENQQPPARNSDGRLRGESHVHAHFPAVRWREARRGPRPRPCPAGNAGPGRAGRNSELLAAVLVVRLRSGFRRGLGVLPRGSRAASPLTPPCGLSCAAWRARVGLGSIRYPMPGIVWVTDGSPSLRPRRLMAADGDVHGPGEGIGVFAHACSSRVSALSAPGLVSGGLRARRTPWLRVRGVARRVWRYE